MSPELRLHLDRHLTIINSNIKDINRGGCGVFALCMYRALNEMGINCTIHVIGYKGNTEDMSMMVDTGDVVGLDCLGWKHIMLGVGGKLFDSNGIYEDFDSHGYYGCGAYCLSKDVGVEFLEKMIDELEWNWMFDKGQVGLLEDLCENICEFAL